MTNLQYSAFRCIGWVTLVLLCAMSLGLPTDWRLWLLIFLSQVAEAIMMTLMPRRQASVESSK